MGAVADHVGNITPVAEYNMWADPHAVDVVLRSGLRLEFVGWDISRHYTVDRQRARRSNCGRSARKRAEFCVDINAVVAQFCATETKLSGFDLPDPVTMAYAIDPLIATAARRLHLAVETESELTRGMVVMDLLEFTDQPPNALVVTAADRDRFLDMLRTAIS